MKSAGYRPRWYNIQRLGKIEIPGLERTPVADLGACQRQWGQARLADGCARRQCEPREADHPLDIGPKGFLRRIA